MKKTLKAIVGAAGIAVLAGCGMTDQEIGGLFMGTLAPYAKDARAGNAMAFTGNAMTELGAAERSRTTVNVYGNQNSQRFVRINELGAEHNVTEDGEKCMIIYVRMKAVGFQGEALTPCGYLTYPGGRPVLRNGEQIAFPAKINARPGFQETDYLDNSVYIAAPYNRMDSADGENSVPLEMKVRVLKNGQVVSDELAIPFTYYRNINNK